MSGLDLNKTRKITIEKFKGAIKDNLFSIVLSGSASQEAYKVGWSDLDFLIVVENFNLDVKCQIARAVEKLENISGIHYGINVISRSEFFDPVLPSTLLDGKTLQSLIGLKKHPNRLIYFKEKIDIQSVYSPSPEVLKKYSLENIGMFLRRNRRILTTATNNPENFKELLKREMRASLIITKLAVQLFTSVSYESYREVLNQAKLLFRDFDFSIVEENFQIIDQWQKFNNHEELLERFRKVDSYIENFSHYIFEKVKNQNATDSLYL